MKRILNWIKSFIFIIITVIENILMMIVGILMILIFLIMSAKEEYKDNMAEERKSEGEENE